MPSFTDVLSGASALASDVQQIIDALKGTSGKGVPLSPTAVNDGVNFALAVRNNDAGASKTAIFYKADGTVLLQVDKNGVVASPDGTAGAAPLVTTTGTQTITNKTLTAPHMTAAVVDSGGFTITAGDISIPRHLLTTGPNLTASAGANAGSSPPAPVVTNTDDIGGTITFGTGTGATAGQMVIVTFANVYGATPRAVVIAHNNSVTAALPLIVSNITSTQFVVQAVNAPASSQANTTYSFTYVVIGAAT